MTIFLKLNIKILKIFIKTIINSLLNEEILKSNPLSSTISIPGAKTNKRFIILLPIIFPIPISRIPILRIFSPGTKDQNQLL